MKLGISITNYSWPGGPDALARHVVDLAHHVDEAGVDTLWVADHLLQMDPNASIDEPMLEAYSTLAFIAGVTRQVQLGAMVTWATIRPPALLIKTVTTLDVLSGGRAWLGVGVGYRGDEAAMTGLPFEPTAERFSRLEELLQLAAHVGRQPFTLRGAAPSPLVTDQRTTTALEAPGAHRRHGRTAHPAPRRPLGDCRSATGCADSPRRRVRATNEMIYFDAGLLSSSSEQVPMWAVRDVDVKQSMTQKARKVGDVIVRLEHSDYTGRSQVTLDSIEDPKGVRDLLNCPWPCESPRWWPVRSPAVAS